jgi:hypothetical protein
MAIQIAFYVGQSSRDIGKINRVVADHRHVPESAQGFEIPLNGHQLEALLEGLSGFLRSALLSKLLGPIPDEVFI